MNKRASESWPLLLVLRLKTQAAEGEKQAKNIQ